MSNVINVSFGDRRLSEQLADEFTATIRERSSVDEQTAKQLAAGIAESFFRMRNAGEWTISVQSIKPGEDPAKWLGAELQRYARHVGDVCSQELFKNFWAALKAGDDMRALK